MCDEEKVLQMVAYVRASKHRQNIIKYLNNKVKTPTDIKNSLNINTNHTSNLLADLRKHDLVYCATPEMKKGRLYKLTEKGEKIVKYLD
ncbi:MAG: winged helix-turn-helix domain-containing protein [Methanobrevibacter sp.]|uniref:winged helix-turn-helix domain-containing protein n=1 Tax=Methanobrevibacter sp. TaxID=66852 RepID=UPI0026DFC062|nr:winged helix-turn-helix domain-containing protein [Methanobrevibacter sp.]MDO5848263.1 winged helix-turn-helix domain-containing protein [Methanobrevibacter sp.]